MTDIAYGNVYGWRIFSIHYIKDKAVIMSFYRYGATADKELTYRASCDIHEMDDKVIEPKQCCYKAHKTTTVPCCENWAQCSCGIYSYHTLKRLLIHQSTVFRSAKIRNWNDINVIFQSRMPEIAIGMVRLQGSTLCYDYGYRSQAVKVERLFLPSVMFNTQCIEFFKNYKGLGVESIPALDSYMSNPQEYTGLIHAIKTPSDVDSMLIDPGEISPAEIDRWCKSG